MQCVMAIPTLSFSAALRPATWESSSSSCCSSSNYSGLYNTDVSSKLIEGTDWQQKGFITTQFRKLGFSGLLLSCLFLSSWNGNGLETARAASGLELESSRAQNGSEDEQDVQVEPSKGNCATCLGVVDDTLGSCGAALNCVSTFDDRPGFFVAPWEFPGKLSTAFKQMVQVLEDGSGTILEQSDSRYIHAIFHDKEGTIDDIEFLFSDPKLDATVNIRSASRKVSLNDRGRNQKRLEEIRKALTWEEVPVLRNRKRKLFFLESPWDTFGPEPPPAFDYGGTLDFVPD